jgi:long-chain acyl-CoA synthetase
MTIKELVKRSSSLFGDAVAFQIKRDGAYKKCSFRKSGEMTANLSSKLSSLGVARGDRVAVLSENRPEWSISFLSIASIGAVVVPLDSLISTLDHATLIKDSGAKGIILSKKFLDGIKMRKAELPALEFIICMDFADGGEGVLSFLESTEKSHGPAIDVKVGDDDLASIVYTSGTTGIAKGVMLTHGNIVSNVLALAELFPMIQPGDNFLSVLPIHHTFETTTGFLCAFYMGATITYAESLKSYSLLANMQETGVSILLGVPLLFRLFFDGIKRGVEEKGIVAKILFKVLFAASSAIKFLTRINVGKWLFPMVHGKLGGNIKFWVSGAAAIDPGVIRGFDLMGITILQGYGLTESAPVLSCCTLKNNRIGSVGRPIPGVEIKIINPNEAGEGEVIARGPNIMKGYYKKPEATAETVRDAWLYTGDVGRLDRDGYLFITGRIKDIIVTGSGLNVYPEELEQELLKSPAVAESCVLGRRIKQGMRKGMEEVVAVIIPQKVEGQGGAEIKKALGDEVQAVNQRVPEYKRISDFIVRETEFPKTSTKKIKRFVLRKELGLI